MRQETITVSDNQIVVSITLHFAALWFKDLHSEQRQKRTIVGDLNNATCKNFQLSKWPYLSTRRQNSKVFSSPMTCSLIVTIFRAWKFYMERFFSEPYTLPTVSYSKHCYVKHYLLERCCSFSKPMFKNFALFRKPEINKMFQKGPVLTVYNRWLNSYDVTKCKF